MNGYSVAFLPRRSSVALCIALTAAMAAAPASARYHVTAFENAAGFDEIMARDYVSASEVIERRGRPSFDRYSNLCVSLMLAEQVEQALESCSQAIRRAPAEYASSFTTVRSSLDRMMTTLYSNRGVAHALQGDMPSAKADFERAVRLDADNANAVQNLKYVQMREIASHVQ